MTKEKFKKAISKTSEAGIPIVAAGIFGDDVSVTIAPGKPDIAAEDAMFNMVTCYAAISVSIAENLGIPTYMLHAMAEELIHSAEIMKPVDNETDYDNNNNIRPFVPSHA